jgi:uncharacterized protein (DUF1697 family)
MPRYIAFLRAINVGGHVVPMAKLKSHFEKLGFTGVETFIASGNVIFETRSKAAATLERRIKRHLLGALGYEVTTFLRTCGEVAAIAECQPFAVPAFKTAVAFNVGLLAAPLNAGQLKRVAGLRSDHDDFRVAGREIYWLCRVRQNESRFTNVRFEKALGLRATFRNRNTLQRLAAKYPA